MGENKQPGALAEIFERGKLVWRLMQDQRVPTWIRIGIPAVVFLYFISPVDIIPDFILGLGQLDDLGRDTAGDVALHQVGSRQRS